MVRQAKLGGFSELEVFIMIKGRESCSQPCGWREQFRWLRPGAAKARAVAISELDSASLQQNESGQPPKEGEASTSPEVPTKRTGWTLRGVRRQHAPTKPSGTWETRHCCTVARQLQPMGRSHNARRCNVEESERPIVAEKFRSEPEWSQGALARVTLSQKPLELIG